MPGGSETIITFAVVGRNEAATVGTALGQAIAAAGPADRVVFVDSASTDGSAAIAESMGVEVVRAPAGKGRAVATLLEGCRDAHVCLVDADIVRSEANIPGALADAFRAEPADMVVAQFTWPEKRVFAISPGIYRPLVGALFPEADGLYGRLPLSGFRIVDASLPLGELPGGFGLEAHLNVLLPALGRRVRSIHVGAYSGPIRDRSGMGREIAEALLDLAVALGRLDPALRPAWDEWVERVMEVIESGPRYGDVDAYHARVAEAGAQPLPPALARAAK